ncbi:hypothetical protein GCM10023322_11550 [Rugosimonospora acidiphila]|uniref:Uncharacterized protein n=1 Tax=Rugosimonospora acidiphila TaxID=556531 RepID=A0ABP9RL99_9ACTN
MRSGTAKSLTYSVLCTLFGVLFVVGGVFTWKHPADCGGQTMQQGDTCEVTQNGSTDNKNLSQQESSNHREAIVMFVLGPLMILGGAAWLGGEIRIRQRRNASAQRGAAIAGAGPFFGPGQAPPQMYNPAQAMGQHPYAASAQQQYGTPQPQQPQAYGAPPQQGWPGQQAPQGWPGQQGQPPQQGWPGQQAPQGWPGQQGQQPQQSGWKGN